MGVCEPRSFRGGGVPLVLLIAAALVGGCDGLAPQATQASQTVPSFRYELSPATDVLTAGEALHYEWAPHPDPNYATKTADVTLCFGLFGPWPDAATLKREFSAPQTAACPPPGATVASESVRTTSSAGTRLTVVAPGPPLPGFYNLRQINIFSAGLSGGSLSFDRVVEVRAR